MVTNEKLVPPFFANDHGDVDVFGTVAEMESYYEAYDLGDLEFFDAVGHRLSGVADGYRVRILPTSSSADPAALEHALRSFFAALPEGRRSYAEAARSAQQLGNLVELRVRLGR